MLMTFFAVGMYFAYFIGAGKNQGLAGGAIVFGYGVIFGVIALVISFILVRFVKVKLIIKFNWILLLSTIIIYGVTILRFQERNKKDVQKELKKEPQSVTEPSMIFLP